MLYTYTYTFTCRPVPWRRAARWSTCTSTRSCIFASTHTCVHVYIYSYLCLYLNVYLYLSVCSYSYLFLYSQGRFVAAGGAPDYEGQWERGLRQGQGRLGFDPEGKAGRSFYFLLLYYFYTILSYYTYILYLHIVLTYYTIIPEGKAGRSFSTYILYYSIL